MQMINHKTGEICSYEDFKIEARKPRRTQAAQRQEIEKCLDKLTEQGDFWNLDRVRKILDRLTKDNIDAENLSFALLSIETAEPGKPVYFIMRKEASK